MGLGLSQRLVGEQARAWFMLHSERELTAGERAEFAQWLAQSDHLASYRELEQIDLGLAAIAATAEGARLREKPGLAALQSLRGFFSGAGWGGSFSGGGNSRSWSAAPALAFACVMVLALGVWTLAPWTPGTEAQIQIYNTQVAQTKSVTLADGSEITLGADSRVEAHFSEGRRDLSLVKGQAFFAVAKDPARPFFVATDSASIRVVGTRFDVHRGPQGVKVAVEEGIVEVTQSGTENEIESASEGKIAPKKAKLLAGQQVRINRASVGDVMQVDIGELASWRKGNFIYHNARLAEVVADANRYREGKIVLGAPQLAELRVTTSFSVSQIDTLVSMLEQTLPLRVYRDAGDRVVLWPRPEGSY